jgi:hypothetical protein
MTTPGRPERRLYPSDDARHEGHVQLTDGRLTLDRTAQLTGWTPLESASVFMALAPFAP